MKKVCMIVPSFTAKGGIATVVSGYRGSTLEQLYNIKYVETYIDGNKVRKLIKAILAYIKFLLLLIIWNPDIIHIHSSFGASFYRKLPIIYFAAWFHKPIINHIHGSALDDLYINANTKKQKLVLKVFNKSSKLVVLSNEWKEKYKNIVPENIISVIENYSILQKVEEIKLQNNRVLFLGFLSKAKGCFDIPIIAKKVGKIISGTTFILAGEGHDEEKNTIHKIIKDNQIDNIVFTGWVRGKEKDELLKSSDIFFLPSYGEAMPMSILEAMGYALPIVTSNIGGIPQLVKDNENGFIFEPGDVEGFSNAIIKILTNVNLKNRLGEKSYEIAKEKYSLEIHVGKIRKLYDQII